MALSVHDPAAARRLEEKFPDPVKRLRPTIEDFREALAGDTKAVIDTAQNILNKKKAFDRFTVNTACAFGNTIIPNKGA